MGPQDNFGTITIGPDDDMEQRRKDILEQVQETDAGNGVIVLTDMFGGTPSNLAISIMEEANVEVIAGVNIPMLVKLVGIRKNDSLLSVTETTRDAGRKYIAVASQILARD